jgi:hypothetical protein
VRLTRLVTVLMASGLALLALAVALSLMTAAAATGDARYDTAAYRYTDKPSAAAMASRTLTIYVDGDFDAAERERIGLALRQWNHVLNGFVRLRPVLLPADASDGAVAQLRRQGAWIVAKVDSRHPAARDRSALAMTVGNRGSARSARPSDGLGLRPQQRPLHRSRRRGDGGVSAAPAAQPAQLVRRAGP